MNRILTIIFDGIILVIISTLFVIAADKAFSGLKGKTPKDDPLVTAILQEDLKQLESQLGDGSAPDAYIDEHGRSPLIRAAYVNLSDAEATAASDSKRAPMAALLISRGAAPDHRDKDGWSALMWASWSGLSKTAAVLIENKASVQTADKQGQTALTLAAARGRAEVVRLLLEHDADPAATARGQSALDLARIGLATHPARKAAYEEILRLLDR